MYGILCQVAFAEELFQQYFVSAAEELISLSSGTGPAVQNGMNLKNQYFSLLYRIVACQEGLQTCLPDFEPASRTRLGTSLVAAGQVSSPVSH